MLASVILYTRVSCHLCEEAKQVVAEARRSTSFNYREIDIDRDPELQRLYNDEVPVITINGSKAFKYRVTMDEFLKKLAARQ